MHSGLSCRTSILSGCWQAFFVGNLGSAFFSSSKKRHACMLKNPCLIVLVHHFFAVERQAKV
jgi:hypothetical protein